MNYKILFIAICAIWVNFRFGKLEKEIKNKGRIYDIGLYLDQDFKKISEKIDGVESRLNTIKDDLEKVKRAINNTEDTVDKIERILQ